MQWLAGVTSKFANILQVKRMIRSDLHLWTLDSLIELTAQHSHRSDLQTLKQNIIKYNLNNKFNQIIDENTMWSAPYVDWMLPYLKFVERFYHLVNVFNCTFCVLTPTFHFSRQNAFSWKVFSQELCEERGPHKVKERKSEIEKRINCIVVSECTK